MSNIKNTAVVTIVDKRNPKKKTKIIFTEFTDGSILHELDLKKPSNFGEEIAMCIHEMKGMLHTLNEIRHEQNKPTGR